MKFCYKFSNLLGTVYRKGNLLFTPDGDSVVSPVGNRITIYDLKNNRSTTLPVESRFNYTTTEISPSGSILISVNEAGEAHLISLISRTVIHRHHFKHSVSCVKFSPNGKHFAVSKENKVFIYRSPDNLAGLINPFIMERVFHDATDDVTCIEWASDSRILAVGSKDMSTKLYSLQKLANFQSYSLGSHTDSLVGCFFEDNSLDLTTVSSNGQVCVWECNIGIDDLVAREPPQKKLRETKDESGSEDDTPRRKEESSLSSETRASQDFEKLFYTRLGRHYLCDEFKGQLGVRLTAATYHRKTRLLVTGYSTGAFLLHELPDVNLIHSLSIDTAISALALNREGDWLAVGSPGLGQLLVWEWQSETYIMKQQGHFNNMRCLSYSPDGQHIVTGGDDGKVKLWNTSTGFCFVTFTEHTAGISAVQFSPNRKFVVSASLDGTVRAFDMARYRNFRTFTSPRPVQFSCLAIDSSAEFVAAGGQDVFEIFLWSLKIGRLVEVLSGHEGPVSSIAFNPSPASTAMASVSWDKTLKLWNAVESGGMHETVQLSADGLCVAYAPSGQEVAVATLDGQVSFFNIRTSQQTGSIEGRNDLGSGRSETDLITAKKNLQGKAFNSLCYTADGKCILAGGQSKNVCIYSVNESMLIKKFEITQNRSLDAVDDYINRRKLTEFGNLSLVEEREQLEGGNVSVNLPGVRRGEMAARATKPEVRVSCLQFSPTGEAWAAATTEGLLVYALDTALVFDPYQLDVDITPSTVREKLYDQEFSEALMMALKLNEKDLIKEVTESIPTDYVILAVQSLPLPYVEKMLKFLAEMVESSRHLEFYLIWVQTLLTLHGQRLQNPSSHSTVTSFLIRLQKNLNKKYQDLMKICDFNKYTIRVLQNVAEHREKAALALETLSVNDDNLMSE
ncbi:periodic tryptophan protein 2 homolog isoform X1 [Schistocerca nitens]|uniref:periodic tryptophan protein 2 homolog isoform X1 n=2 Tax=Schistocerca nitens TaxID=7011 RepID=UPI00211927B9|nr:periodic tryptophan protein 2 homolog isoform X1 [Schistocerca nitens]